MVGNGISEPSTVSRKICGTCFFQNPALPVETLFWGGGLFNVTFGLEETGENLHHTVLCKYIDVHSRKIDHGGPQNDGPWKR